MKGSEQNSARTTEGGWMPRWLVEMLSAGWSFGAPLGVLGDMALTWKEGQAPRAKR